MSGIQKKLLDVYGLTTEETGTTQLSGTKCLGFQDMPPTISCMGDLLFGEILFAGVERLLDDTHCCVGAATEVIDLGMGIGKLCMQVFLSHPHVKRVIGIEMAPSRAHLAFDAADKLVSLAAASSPVVLECSYRTMKQLIVKESTTTTTTGPAPPAPAVAVAVHQKRRRRVVDPMLPRAKRNKRRHSIELTVPPAAASAVVRTLELRCGDLFDIGADLVSADIVICQTAFLRTTFTRLCILLSTMKAGARLVSYHDIQSIYSDLKVDFPFERLPANRSSEDRFLATWAPLKGHHFHLWVKKK